MPMLQYQQPDHDDNIGVQATASALGVGVDIPEERTEGHLSRSNR